MPRILRHIVITLLCFSAAAAASAQTDALLSQAYAVPGRYQEFVKELNLTGITKSPAKHLQV